MASYRDNPANTPLTSEGTPLGGGPWVLAREGTTDRAYHWDVNNGVIGVCTAQDPNSLDSDYVVHVAPFSEANAEYIRKAGFSADLGVPYSNGERPANTEIGEFKEHCYAMHRLQDSRDEHGYLVNLQDVTGAGFTRTGDENDHKVEVVSDGKQIGCCNLSKTGVFAYVDGNGHTHITGKNGESWLQKFTALGIPHNSEIVVPFAKGEQYKSTEDSKVSSFAVQAIRDAQSGMAYQQRLRVIRKQEEAAKPAEPVADAAPVSAEPEPQKGGWMEQQGTRRDFLRSMTGARPAEQSSVEIAASQKGKGFELKP